MEQGVRESSYEYRSDRASGRSTIRTNSSFCLLGLSRNRICPEQSTAVAAPPWRWFWFFVYAGSRIFELILAVNFQNFNLVKLKENHSTARHARHVNFPCAMMTLGGGIQMVSGRPKHKFVCYLSLGLTRHVGDGTAKPS